MDWLKIEIAFSWGFFLGFVGSLLDLKNILYNILEKVILVPWTEKIINLNLHIEI